MNEQDFIEKIVEIMDTEDDVRMDSVLANFEDWDSLSLVSFLAFCSTLSENKVTPTQVREAKTVQNLFDLAFGK
ncbi:hypothetical protein [Anaerovibrio lipolyticus]|uniref:hypothetical protein n=1 Tax=Anaerovibrio lipolyticus TaxID=82374 RepID=UPI000482C1F1|nr:hypothetical protein [Anaerovibrio lipolyticus]